jgi:hypothetical protein
MTPETEVDFCVFPALWQAGLISFSFKRVSGQSLISSGFAAAA